MLLAASWSGLVVTPHTEVESGVAEAHIVVAEAHIGVAEAHIGVAEAHIVAAEAHIVVAEAHIAVAEVHTEIVEVHTAASGIRTAVAGAHIEEILGMAVPGRIYTEVMFDYPVVELRSKGFGAKPGTAVVAFEDIEKHNPENQSIRIQGNRYS